MKALPLLPNGKIDRNALPVPKPAAKASATTRRSKPESAAEHAIAAIWCDLLDLESVDLRDNFFDLGGHSLLAMRAVIEIRNKLGWEVVPQRLVYENLGQIARPRESVAAMADPR
jgi:acyl carrier protein